MRSAWEAQDEGPQAVRELEQFREEFSLASQLIESRRDSTLSQRQLAKLSGVSQSEISRIEMGASNPTYATITALLRSLGKRIQPAYSGKMAARKAGVARGRRVMRADAKAKASRPRKPVARKPTAKTP